jgi:hypothetical protein
MTPISGVCFIPVHMEEFNGVLFRRSLICLSGLSFFPSTVIKSYKQREGAIAAGTKRAASGLGTDFRGHGLPVYIQSQLLQNVAQNHYRKTREFNILEHCHAISPRKRALEEEVSLRTPGEVM